MWMMIELPDECQDAVNDLIAWHNKPEQMVSSVSPVVTITQATDVKLAGRVLDIQTQ